MLPLRLHTIMYKPMKYILAVYLARLHSFLAIGPWLILLTPTLSVSDKLAKLE